MAARFNQSLLRAALTNFTSEIVSDESETLILVDSNDNVLGHLDKSACHDGDGTLHRAFSLFIFNPAGELLLQQRAANKRLWPNYWSNSCCSHPRKNETLEVAVQRRCEQELGFRTPLKFLYKFEYSAKFDDFGSENELCSVFVGCYDGQPTANATEVQAWQWFSPVKIEAELAANPAQYTPWFKLEWERLREDFSTEITPQ